jgi:drug/metabolite transporter (DMT)-like permease
MPKIRASPFALLVLCVAMGSLGQICMKAGLRGDEIPLGSSPLGTVAGVVPFLVRPLVLAGISLYTVSTGLWLLVLHWMPLSVAFPMVSLGYVLVVLLSAFVLHEPVEWFFAVPGLSCIVAGVSLIALGRVGEQAGSGCGAPPTSCPSGGTREERILR